MGGVLFAASLVFFAYIGFDVVATTAEEAAHPQQDLPIGILGSLVICTVLYVAVALVITGMVNYKDINPDAALAHGVHRPGQGRLRHADLGRRGRRAHHGRDDPADRRRARDVRDVPRQPAAAPLRPRLAQTGTPIRITLAIGVIVALIASLTPVGRLEEMVNIGTLTAFLLVSISIPILRKRRPDLPRSFKVPGRRGCRGCRQ